MTFGPDHYVPILKVKRAEKTALGYLAPALRSRITPLLEIVERKDKTIEGHLETAFNNLSESAKGYPRCFLDAREIEPDGPRAATQVFGRAAAAGIAFTPVTGISRTADVQAALGHQDHHGLAVRLTRAEFEGGDLTSRIDDFLGRHQIAASAVDLIVDLGAVENLIPAGVEALTNAFLNDVPDHGSWRTFTVSACAFPVSMGGVERNSHEFVERADWIAWRDNLHGRRGEFERLPSFGDCAIQHSKGVEGFAPRTMQVSASIRYTCDQDWLLVKGESTKSKPAIHQFPDLAMRLVYGHLKDRFAGPAHCAGCRSMKEAADGARGYGAPEAWRRLGTIHHITRVVQDLDSLPAT